MKTPSSKTKCWFSKVLFSCRSIGAVGSPIHLCRAFKPDLFRRRNSPERACKGSHRSHREMRRRRSSEANIVKAKLQVGGGVRSELAVRGGFAVWRVNGSGPI